MKYEKMCKMHNNDFGKRFIVGKMYYMQEL